MEIRLAKILTRARALLASGWTTGADARSADLSRVEYHDPAAVSFCMVGALALASRETEGNDASGYAIACKRIRDVLIAEGMEGMSKDTDIVDVNDRPGQTLANVLGYFDKAISK